jgi:CBS domain-containing membrane protein
MPLHDDVRQESAGLSGMMYGTYIIRSAHPTADRFVHALPALPRPQKATRKLRRISLPTTPRFKLFAPILAGATLRDRMLACGGALLGIAVTGFLCSLLAGAAPHMLLLVPPMGASAVLAFAVPSSPMAQPWPTIGGNAISALVGVVVAHNIAEPALAAGIAVGVAIGAMSLLRCLHPPGGAAALVAVFAGGSADYLFPLVPVALNAAVLVGCALAYHRFSGHAYPHVAVRPAAAETGRPNFREEDIAATLEELGEAFDISTDDLKFLLREIEKRALARSRRDLAGAIVRSRDAVPVRERSSA